jgi:hypothetical protein
MHRGAPQSHGFRATYKVGGMLTRPYSSITTCREALLTVSEGTRSPILLSRVGSLVDCQEIHPHMHAKLSTVHDFSPSLNLLFYDLASFQIRVYRVQYTRFMHCTLLVLTEHELLRQCQELLYKLLASHIRQQIPCLAQACVQL